ncbi:late embryogenesis abundant protein At1g64065-like [Salvia miltiorrhiza]|uniref:late embryogenesis abundant protein At1g64065-like n=1 Tax=Salvia miltiorrhiza TaxID=226208 RepID=UPI0025AC8BE5|nr:late embryogenesis abundant protein At1g64065-like [Salvia miltiorrhiza]
MVETSEQIRPLAPASERPTSSDDEAGATAVGGGRRRRQQLLRCCGCCGAVVLLQAVVIVILIFTVFKVKDPVIRLNGVTVDRLDLINGTATPRPGSNMSLTADVSVKNPNFASFRYPETTSALFYRGAAIGEARGPAGRARARRTARMNVTVEVIADRVLAQPDLGSDINSGLLTLGSYTEVGGKVKILMVKKHVRVTMNCSLTVNVTSQAIQGQKCKRKVKF